ncbi:MAG: hypothetical protein HOC71_06545 [Candidatus Latescibacteria bacterium]|jgi:hypothetical protein|nr:hypothetical protein [Candidatus Latescibacterota bacterium]
MVWQNHMILKKTKRQRLRKQQKRRDRKSGKRRTNNFLLAPCLSAFQDILKHGGGLGRFEAFCLINEMLAAAEKITKFGT